MGQLFTWVIVQPMGFIIELIYRLIPNYGVAIILFTVIIKLLLLPLGIKSQKSMAKQQKLAPQLAELQKKYANDKEKLNKEMLELYQANGVSPASGCLPMLLQFPIIIGLFQVIQKPLSYMLRINFNLPENIDKVLSLQETVRNTPNLLAMMPSGFDTASMQSLADNFQIAMSNIAAHVEGFANWVINFNFLGIDLSKYPTSVLDPLMQLMAGKIAPNLLETLPLLLIPVLAGVSSWVLSKMTPQQTPQPPAGGTADAAAPAANMGKTMMLMMPIMSLVFTFSLPAGVGLYWTISNVAQMAQQYFMQKYFKKKEEDTVVIDTVKKNRKNGKKHR